MGTNMAHKQSDKHLLLAKQIFTSFPLLVTGLKVFNLDCGCIYFQRVFRDGVIDSYHIGIYRDLEDGPCDICMHFEKDWKDRVINESVVYNSKFQLVDK